jgi:hypothetical protein
MTRDTSLPVSMLLSLSFVGVLAACDKIKDAAGAITETGPTTSYCEALCDWGVACAVEDRPVDEDELNEACLDATHDVDGNCSAAENGSIDAAARPTLSLCVSSVDTFGCDAINGNELEVKGARVEAMGTDCVTYDTSGAQATFDAARQAVMEGGAEMCDRMTDTFCGAITQCFIDKVSALDAQKETIMEQCQSTLFGGITSTCKSDGRYAQPVSLLEYNENRFFAQQCLNDEAWDGDACAAVTTGMPATCLGAVPELTTFAADLAEFGLEFGVSI